LEEALPPEVLQARAQEVLRARNAEEKVRQQQQGYGRPIVSLEHSGHRIVGVGSAVYWGKHWRVFPDFLFYFLKKTFDFRWGAREQANNSPHPIFRWLARLKEYQAKHEVRAGQMVSGPLVGFLSSTIHLAYALYLIAHNDQIPGRLLRRLRDPTTFMPAYYETLVGAVLAVAGFEIENAETKATDTPTPEFRGRSKKTGKVYEMEAKRKDRWASETRDPENAEFRRELQSYVRRQIHRASKKRLNNPVFWLELSVPTLTTEKDWQTIAEIVKATIRDTETTMTIDGKPIAPAFVVVTNHTFLANEDVGGETSFALLEPLRVTDYPYNRAIEIETALEAYDKYRDVFEMMEAWRVARTIPLTFDGTPAELLSEDELKPQRPIQIGDDLIVMDEHGKEVVTRVTEITSVDNKAMVAVYDAGQDRAWIVEVPLTDGEIKAAARFTDAIFGKDNASRRLRDDNPFDLYDWLLNAYANITAEQLAKLFREDANLHQYEQLPLKEARVRLCREYTKSMWSAATTRRGKAPDENPA
jgi:hypothetical protein